MEVLSFGLPCCVVIHLVITVVNIYIIYLHLHISLNGLNFAISECHQLLINGENGVDDSAFSASSTLSGYAEVYSPSRARFGEVEITDMEIKAGAWLPRLSDDKQWLQV